MAVMQMVKDNPWVVLIGSSGTIITLVATLFTLDSRYAHAADVEKNYSQLQQAVQQSTNAIRKQMLEDKIFELDLKKAQSPDRKLSPVDVALEERYKRELRDLENQERAQAQQMKQK
jgi:biopolymer transport protein ExbB/TolQ